MFKINKIQHEPSKKDNGCFMIEINFSCSEEQERSFGTLGKYHKATHVTDIQKFEDHYNDNSNFEYETEQIEGTEFSHLKWKKPSAYDLGLVKIVDVEGLDKINKQEDGTFTYKEFVTDCYITTAAVKQLFEMKQHMDTGFCRWGDYPEQVGAFRSGDPFSDFIGILETLDRFWD
jgi:hypothetical protein